MWGFAWAEISHETKTVRLSDCSNKKADLYKIDFLYALRAKSQYRIV